MSAKKPWQGWEADIVRDMRRGELSIVARLLNRTTQSVASFRHRHGMGPPKRPWQPWEDIRADKMIVRGASLVDVAKALGRTRACVDVRRCLRRARGEHVPLVFAGGRWYESRAGRRVLPRNDMETTT